MPSRTPARTIRRCSSNAACIRRGSRTRSCSRTTAGRRCSSTRARRSSRSSRSVEREGLTPTHLLITHGHADHVAGNDELVDRFGLEVTTGAVETGDLRIEVLATPGHSDDGVSFVVGNELCFTGDTLFKDSVGGGAADEVRRSVMDVLMALPHEMRVLPGHTDETTIGREWEENPFVRFWRGLDSRGRSRLPRARRGRDARRLVAGLRRQGEGARAARRRRRGDRRSSAGSKVSDRGQVPPLPVRKVKVGACWTVQQALDEQGIEYEIVIEPTYPRGKRKDVIEHTGQHYLPAIELEDGTWYREESKAMAETIRAGRLFEKAGSPIP